ncbi:hypothetical protein [Streptomonospora salina]|uniref:Threonine dehydrogenase-like Zn-dependent dehydrogenase n=1 Tax=Streptomonospora salina TaxID=104205 RepID=A0A841EFC7_9ACTN|nr:hypothetical protein [Streptomonospora salina]MBB5998111.1 threonine dehydrogenase-like Zn-dependent dehydrogenase [Streptomonospora salina]
MWDYRGINAVDQPTPMGHKYVGVVEEVGEVVVRLVLPPQHLRNLPHGLPVPLRARRTRRSRQRAQAELLRGPLVDGTLVATPDVPDEDLIPSLLTASEVLGTG